ncbi:hypothetical protein C0Q70_16437 [Pomacea canaliculata]|uniref:Sugar phosphate transporter domain-containing protein n=1 Tax=Pomacea canaliculata TaxID=400727 RepID=A0A2T7NPS5_POMCA|nr:hypothetical protein C0Q70_16437 [Pomacea canaliculata]
MTASGVGDGKRSEAELTATSAAASQDAAAERPMLHRLLAVLFYGFSSIIIMITNKLVLTSQGFPSYLTLGLGQIWPLPLFYFGSMVFGLGGTKSLSLPMLIVLRRFTNLFIMIAEYFILGVVATPFVQFSVFLMIAGAVVAASNDMSFDFAGYAFVLCANVCTCMNGVFTKKKLDAKELGQTGLMFYNSLIMMGPAFALTYCTGELDKNLFVTYVGMYIGGDYVFSLVNFIGINVRSAFRAVQTCNMDSQQSLVTPPFFFVAVAGSRRSIYGTLMLVELPDVCTLHFDVFVLMLES